ncbi:PASTA domain-containing protein [Actinomadura sp. 21ATH]|uniref:PASTA domain-containing protein n=1 Tax=Actinomadura sp. 21ATH TaxID=1735444 RepID=UPI0035C1B86F
MRLTALAAILLAALTLTACGGTPSADPAPAVTVTETAPSSPAGGEPADKTPAAPAAEKIKVPNVVGKNHQQAQNEMQAAGLYVLAEVDATGQGRTMILDRNWEVVRQSPKAGTRVTPDTRITLYSKKVTD